ncbi:Homoserine kinase [Candidatus Bealeia paramacronuclearis]|uniref:Homoserine kinase n=1 Tax=Candidatus Bealeia paramacronuclearis TaxID=1921001 RepID=A0ABZ2C7I7_9PROT|nr:Homoserine kinase [Candidatus Bealeia paramacronuclearis]
MWNAPLQRLDQRQIPSFLQKTYGADLESVKLISNGINLVFRFEKEGRGYYLKLTHEALRPQTALQEAILFHQFLFENTLPVPEIVFSQNGKTIEVLSQNEDVFLAHVMKEVLGESIAPLDKIGNLTPEVLKNWGRTLAQFHKIAQGYAKAPMFKRGNDIFEEFDGYVSQENSALQHEYNDVKNKILALPRTPFNFGVIHGDHRPGNVLIQGGRIFLIDFDEPLNACLMKDIARPFFDLYVENDLRLFEKSKPFFEGYIEVLPQMLLNFEDFLLFLRLKALDIYLWTINNWHSDIAPGGGNVREWMSRIRNSIESEASNSKCYRFLAPTGQIVQYDPVIV